MKKKQAEHRAPIDIVSDILHIAKKDDTEKQETGALQTQIMYKANISFKQVKEYLKPLTSESSNLPQSFKRRSKFDIIIDILELAKDGTKKTYIMYRCNLSGTQLNDYLRFLKKQQLLEETEGIYSTTKNGLTIVESYAKLIELTKCALLKLTNGRYEITEKGDDFLKEYGNLRALLNPPVFSTTEGSLALYAGNRNSGL